MTHDVTVLIAALGVAGQVAFGAGLLAVLAAAAGVPGPLRALRSALWGYELWAVFAVAAVGTAGSLFFSEVANYVPCELCWFERICLYPLTAVALLAALASDYRVARYLLPLPVAGASVAVYHLLIERGVVGQSTTCLASAPGGCATRWIEEFGYVTIPVLALTGFLVVLSLLVLAAAGGQEESHAIAPVVAHA